jgi:RNA polymerase sigma factor (sigma-70 family)
LDKVLGKALGGDKSAERELFEILRVRLLYVAKLYVREDDAEDIIQEAMMTIAQKYKSISDPTHFPAWAYKIVRNKIGNYVSKNKSRRTYLEYLEAVAANSNSPIKRDATELVSSLLKCLKHISQTNLRYARILNFVNLGYTTEEICDILKIKRGHVYVLLGRGRSLLLRCLNDEY